ncbi:MAG: AmmeMemoRadiSam system protein A [Desulfovibrio sp.]|uniref:AmmeMemoRadiSam system protein A n=1 Tax=Desulfovibrio sp. TaxID=885 RepID=UPI001A7566AE|nr:AmmeMemoRadiSam system protein A [Desulfovibrio sp.]MBD5417086.1 AmmeMemoRadiSam system protein A [Desulfovibrio sp.]
MGLSFDLDAAEKAWLSRLARQSIALAVGAAPVLTGVTSLTEAMASPEALNGEEHPVLRRPLGAFVTITLGGNLRGCIGTIVGREPLEENVWRMARAAALEDPRFPPLSAREWERANLEISVLDELTPCPDPARVEVGRHGLALQYGGRSGVFLPQVPVEQGWDREAYLDHLCVKAGVPVGAWRLPLARLFWYEAQVFPA